MTRERALRGPGRTIDAARRAWAERATGADLSDVRLHTGPAVRVAALAAGASGFTVGRDIAIAVGPGRSIPERLLTHELVHAAQQSAPGQATPEEAEQQARAVDSGADVSTLLGTDGAQVAYAAMDWLNSTRDVRVYGLSALLDELNEVQEWIDRQNTNSPELSRMEEAKLVLQAEITRRQGAMAAQDRLSTTARAADPSGSSSSTQAVELALRDHAPSGRTSATARRPSGEDVARLSAVQKLERAWDFARPEIGPAARREVEALFSPQSLFAMAAFAALFIAAQLTPAGWVADALALTVLSISILFVGMVVIDIARDLWRFFAAVNAASEQDLRQSGSALARALARGGVAIVIALLSRALPRGGGSRPTATAELVPAGMGPMRIPVRVAALTDVPASIPVASRYASYAVMMSPGGGGGGSQPNEQSENPSSGSRGNITPSRRVRGPEIWNEITAELSLESPGTGARRGGGIRLAVEDAVEAGFVDSAGRPGTTDLAVHPHSSAPAVRAATGTTGAQTNSAHIAPTVFVRRVDGYSRGRALTTGLDPVTHRLFDSWKSWARERRRAGDTTCRVHELYARMVDDISRISDDVMPQRTKNALAWRLEQEFRELGLSMDSTLELPYKNIASE